MLPLGLTLYVVSALVGLIASPVESAFQTVLPLFYKDGAHIPDFKTGPNHVLLVLASALVMVVLLVIAGWLSKRLFGKVLHNWFARLVERTPGLGTLYSSIRQMVDALSGRNKEMFRRVVLVEYPRAGAWSIAFLTHEKPQIFSDSLGHEVVNVFVPTSPTPTSGFVLQIPPADIRETKLTVSEAIGLLVSFGAVMPRSEPKK